MICASFHLTICTTCELTINKEAINKRFKCGICEKDHYIPGDGFTLNEKIYELLQLSPWKYHGEMNMKNLKKTSIKIQSIVKLLWSNFKNMISLKIIVMNK